MLCIGCGFKNTEGARFCSQCGAPAANSSGVAARPARDQPATQHSDGKHSEAERRQLTVMFTDLVGSTALSEQLDPEDLREILRDYQEVCSRIIERYDGYLAKYLGDGLLVYFGYPRAHEDDAQRATRAGLSILEGIERMHARHKSAKGIDLAVRIGIHTGLVVAGDMDAGARLEQMAIVGETPNIAARLQSLAEPNTLVVSAATYHLMHGYFESTRLADQMLKGISQPMEVYRVLHESTARSRFDIAATAGLTPLAGREDEVGQLVDAWRRARDGSGQVVLLNGEPGIGKSRLVHTLKQHVAQDAHGWLTEFACSAYHQNSAFYPVIDLLERVVLQFERTDSPEEKLNSIEAFLLQYGFPLEETVPLIAALMSVPLGDRYAPRPLPPDRQKQLTMEALAEVLLRRAATQPLLCVFEDLHWIDPSSLDLLGLIIAGAPGTRMLVLVTCRPEFEARWANQTPVTRIAVNRFSHSVGEEMVAALGHGKSLPREVIDQIVAKTDGVPLFVEELTKMVLESGILDEEDDRYVLTGPLPTLAIPTTLKDSLMARLDRMSSVKMVAQLGATIGRTFPFDLIESVSGSDAATLENELNQLITAGLLYRHGTAPNASYSFKHALIQDAAYESLLRSRRQQYHQLIAEAFENRFPETVATRPELVAHHYAAAGLAERAIPRLQQAAQLALQRSANLEAVSHLRRALDLLESLPEGPARLQTELELQITLGPAYMAIRGYSAPEVQVAYSRAREICRLIGDTPQIVPVLWGLWAYYVVRADLFTAPLLTEEMLRLSLPTDDPDMIIEPMLANGATLYYSGDQPAASAALARVLGYYVPSRHQPHAFVYGCDPGMAGGVYYGMSLWVSGYPDQALAVSAEAVRNARAFAHPHTLAFCLSFAARIAQQCGHLELLRTISEEGVAISLEHGFPIWGGQCMMLHGWLRMREGDLAGGTEEIREGLRMRRSTGAVLLEPYFLAVLAEACHESGNPAEALALVDEALEEVANNGEELDLAELLRLKGEILYTLNRRADESASCYREALAAAGRQGARSWELRTAISLSRLHARTGMSDEPLEQLMSIFAQYDEGFDTTDLIQARSLVTGRSLHRRIPSS